MADDWSPQELDPGTLRERYPQEQARYDQALQRVREGTDNRVARIEGARSDGPGVPAEIGALARSGRASALVSLLPFTAPGGRWCVAAGRAVIALGRRHRETLYLLLQEAGLLGVPWGLELLSCAGDARAVPGLAAQLERATRHFPRGVRDAWDLASWALCRLGRLRTAEALDAILPCAQHASLGLRHAALAELGHFDDPRAVQALWEAQRVSGVEGIAQVGLIKRCRREIPELVAGAVRHPELKLRICAVLALRWSEDPRADTLLREALADEDSRIRDWAREALAMRPGWVPVRRHRHEIPRSAALEVLLDWLIERAPSPLAPRPAPRGVLRRLARTGAPPALMALYGRTRGHLPGLLPDDRPWRLLPGGLACLARAGEGWPFAVPRPAWRRQANLIGPALLAARDGRILLRDAGLTVVAESFEAFLQGQLQRLVGERDG